MNITDLINQSSFDIYFLVVDKFLDINVPKLKNFESLYSPDKKIKNSGRLLSQTAIVNHILQKSKRTKRQVAIVPFKPSAKLEFLCKKHNWLLAANKTHLNRLLEDKLKFSPLCEKENIPVIPFKIDLLSEENFLKYQQLFGKTLVIQTHFGWAGNSTFFADNFSQIDQNLTNTSVKFSPYFKGYSLLNNCCLIKHCLLQSPPALQYTGLKPLTQNPFTTVGRQWPSMASLSILKQIKLITEKFTEILKRLDYKGWFGLDFIVHKDKVFLSECNPRLTASFAFYTKIEERDHLTPLFYYHLAEFLNLNYQIDPANEASRFESSLSGSELVLRDENNRQIKKINRFFPFSNKTDPINIDQRIIDKLIK